MRIFLYGGSCFVLRYLAISSSCRTDRLVNVTPGPQPKQVERRPHPSHFLSEMSM